MAFAMARRRAAAGEPTDLNLRVLQQILNDNDGVVPLRVEQVDYPHLKRCLNAGMLEQTERGGPLVLTMLGKSMLNAWIAKTART